MKTQTRIFSVATTIACLALASPAFAQSYGGGNGGAVQVDLGALNELPGAGPPQPYSEPAAYSAPHYRSNRVENADDFPTTIVGGGGNMVAPVSDVQTVPSSSYVPSSPYMPARHTKRQPPHHVAVRKHHAPAAEVEKPYVAPAAHHAASHAHRVSKTIVHTPSAPPPPLASTEELNYMQLTAGRPTLPGGPPIIGHSSGTVREVAMLPTPQPADTISNEPTPLNDMPTQAPTAAASAPAILPNRSTGSARRAATPITAPEPQTPYNPTPLPPAAYIQNVPAPAPAREDYDEPRRQPAIPSEPPLPPAGPAPAATPDDLIDEAPVKTQSSTTRIISDPYAQRQQQSPQHVPVSYISSDNSAPSSGGYSTGYYDIPSTISVGNPVVSQPMPQPRQATPSARVSGVSDMTPQPQMLKVAPPVAADTTQNLNRMEEAKSAQGMSAMPLDEPTPLITNRPPVAPVNPAPPETPPADTSVGKMAPASDTVDSTKTLNHLEDTKTAAADIEAVPLDAPTPLITKSAPVAPVAQKAAPIERISKAVPPQKSGDDLAVTYGAGSTSLSADDNARLDSLASRLKQNADLRVELRSMASATGKDSTSKARRTSLSRALEIKSYLARQGVSEDRIDVRALGAPPGETPTDRVDFFLMR